MTKAPDWSRGLSSRAVVHEPSVEVTLGLLGQEVDGHHDPIGEGIAVRLGRADRCAGRHRDRLTDGDDVPRAPAPLPPLGTGALDILGSYDGDGDDRCAGGEGHIGHAALGLATAGLADDLTLDVDGDGAISLKDLDGLCGRFERPLRAAVYRDSPEPLQDAAHERVLEQLRHRHEGDIRAELDDRREQADRVKLRTVV